MALKCLVNLAKFGDFSSFCSFTQSKSSPASIFQKCWASNNVICSARSQDLKCSKELAFSEKGINNTFIPVQIMTDILLAILTCCSFATYLTFILIWCSFQFGFWVFRYLASLTLALKISNMVNPVSFQKYFINIQIWKIPYVRKRKTPFQTVKMSKKSKWRQVRRKLKYGTNYS